MNETAVKALMARLALIVREHQERGSEKTVRAVVDILDLRFAPVLKRLEAVEKRPSPERGEKGEQGPPGEDAPAGPSAEEVAVQLEPVVLKLLGGRIEKAQEEKQLSLDEADAEWNARIRKSLGDDYPEGNDLG